MSSRSNLSIGLAGIQAMQTNIVQTSGQALPPVGSPPLAPTVVPTPTTPSGEKETADAEKSNTMLYVGIGVGVVILIVVAYFIFRKK